MNNYHILNMGIKPNPRHIILTTVVILLMCGTASAWLSGYDHRMEITVNNTGGSSLSYYQFNFTNDTNILVSLGHMQVSGADCRITDSSDNLIPFWNETSFNVAGTKIWANATTLATGDNTFYMYYGNAGASSVTDGFTTFPFFEDFEDGDVSDWSGGMTTFEVNSSIVKSGTYGGYGYSSDWLYKYMTFATAIDYDFIIDLDIYPTDNVSARQYGVAKDAVADRTNAVYAFAANDGDFSSFDGTTTTDWCTYQANQWYKVRGEVDISADTYTGYVDNLTTPKQTGLGTWGSFSGNANSFYIRTAGTHQNYDNIFIHKYASPKPVTTLGVEEMNPENDYIPPVPTNLQFSNGSSWVNYTWSAGSGNVTDSYNVLLNGVWHNGSSNVFHNATNLCSGAWANISVYAYNTSGDNRNSESAISDQQQTTSLEFVSNGYFNRVLICVGNVALGDYQFKVRIHSAAGTNNNTDIFLNTNNQTDYFSDIRFYNDSGSLISYWIEDVYADPVNVWFNATNAGTVQLYYGKSGVSSASDGGTTFNFFDDSFSLHDDPERWYDNPIIRINTSNYWEDKNVRAASVLYDDEDEIWKMWYMSGNATGTWYLSTISYATSDDGINWTKYAGNPVMDYIPDEEYPRSPCVLKINSSMYYMYYSARDSWDWDNYEWERIFLATSPDGITWTRSANNPIISNMTANPNSLTYGNKNKGEPAVVYFNDTWYMIHPINPAVGSTDWEQILSTSSEHDANWSHIKYTVHRGAAECQKEVGNCPCYIHTWNGTRAQLINGKYWQIHSCWAPHPIRLKLKSSTDMLNWADEGTIMLPNGTGWDSNEAHFAEAILREDGTLYIYYTAQSGGSNWQIGLAKVYNFTDWLNSWETVDGTYTSDNNYLHGGGCTQGGVAGHGAYKNFTATTNTNRAWELKFRFDSGADHTWYFAPIWDGLWHDYMFRFKTDDTYQLVRHNYTSQMTPLIDSTWSYDYNWHTTKLTYNSSGGFELFLDNVSKGTAIDIDTNISSNQHVDFCPAGAIAYDLDDLRIYKYSEDVSMSIGAEEDTPAGITDIVLAANQHGMLRKDVDAAQNFGTIAAGIDHDRCYTWWDSTNDRWESYRVGYSYNSAKSVPEHDSYFVLMDGTGTTISCNVASAETIAIPAGYYATYLRESTNKTLSAIKTDMGGNVDDLWAFNSTAGAWTDTGAYSVQPNQGLMVNSSTGFSWDGAVS